MSHFRSQIHLLPVDSHLRLVYELVLSELAVQSSQLQRMQLQCESWPYLLQIISLPVLRELIPVVPEEYEISLVIECDHCPAHEVRRLREQSSEHPSDSMASHGVEVVQDQLGVVRRGVAMVVDL